MPNEDARDLIVDGAIVRTRGRWTRLTWLATGAAWAGSTLLHLTPARYWDPASRLDYATVLTYSAAWCLLAPSVILLARHTTLAATWIAAVAAVGSIVTGVANLVEDGVGVSFFGAFYVLGFFTGWLAVLALSLAVWSAKQARLAVVVVVLFLGILLITSVGGLLILVALTALSVRPAWFLRRIPEAPISDALDAREGLL